LSRLLAFAAIVMFSFVFVMPPILIHFLTFEEVSFTVEHRERVTNREGASRYMIWGDLGDRTEVFENVDSILSLKFNSADLYGVMRTGAECTAVVNGLRVPFFSMNRNILSVQCTRNEESA
jgi:hypothetical protein